MKEFKPDWDAMAVMVEEQQRMAKKIEELEARIAEYRNPQQRKDLMEQGGAGMKQCSSCGGFCGRGSCKRENVEPKKWVGLTDEDIIKTIGDVIGFNSCVGMEEDFARAIEAKLKEKNA